jgi:hypothetical protein
MYKPDARTLPIETQNYLCQQSIQLRKQHKRVCDIAMYLGVSRSAVSKWWRQYQYEGQAATLAGNLFMHFLTCLCRVQHWRAGLWPMPALICLVPALA